MTPYRGWVVVRGCRRVTRMERCLGAPLFRSLGIVRGGVGGCFRQRCCGRCHVDDGNDIDTLNMSGSFYLECLSSVLYKHTRTLSLSVSLYIFIDVYHNLFLYEPRTILQRQHPKSQLFGERVLLVFSRFQFHPICVRRGKWTNRYSFGRGTNAWHVMTSLKGWRQEWTKQSTWFQLEVSCDVSLLTEPNRGFIPTNLQLYTCISFRYPFLQLYTCILHIHIYIHSALFLSLYTYKWINLSPWWKLWHVYHHWWPPWCCCAVRVRPSPP